MKKFLTYVCLAVFLFAGVYASVTMSGFDRTISQLPVAQLQAEPGSYSVDGANGAAAVIVQQNLEETHAVNDVTSIVFDFRGYDTMGEAFILITAVAGAAVILYNGKKEKKEEAKDE